MSDSLQLAAYIGLDWADQHHAVSLQEADSRTVERSELSQTPEALTEWITALRQRFGGRPVAICLETSHGPLVHALLEHDFVVLYPINPKSLKRFREAFAPSGAKDDPDDADLLRELLTKHGDRLERWVPDDADTRALARLVQARRKAVDLRTQFTQMLTAELKGYFPQALTWTGTDLTARLATDFLLRWPTLETLQRARPQTVRRFYYAHNCRRGDVVEQRLKEIASAVPLTTDPAIVETSALSVQMFARQINGKSRRSAPASYASRRRSRSVLSATRIRTSFAPYRGSGPRLRPTAPDRVGQPARALQLRRRDPAVFRHCAHHRT